MKSVLKIICILTLITSFLPLAACANKTKTAEADAQKSALSQKLKDFTSSERAEKSTKYMTLLLDLTKDQSEQVYDINVQYNPKIENVLVSDKRSFSKARSLKKVMKEKDAALQKVLTGQQYDKYTQAKELLIEEIKNR
ncbi:hypothetical protein JD969_15600 [Planctomycetota bacterium]|nr:hypothetical protein JD969_15600 [Planctomycetota bacterium]